MSDRHRQYRDYFFELVQKNWPVFWVNARALKRWNQETPFCNYLDRSGLLKTPSGLVRMKFHVPVDAGRRFIDFVLHEPGSTAVDGSWAGIGGTCEFKGLARHTLFDFQPKWFPRVLEDVRKQYAAALVHPGIEHFFICTAVLDSPQKRRSVKLSVLPALQELRAEITRRLSIDESAVELCGIHVFDEINPDMFMFVWSIGSPDPPAKLMEVTTQTSD